MAKHFFFGIAAVIVFSFLIFGCVSQPDGPSPAAQQGLGETPAPAGGQANPQAGQVENDGGQAVPNSANPDLPNAGGQATPNAQKTKYEITAQAIQYSQKIRQEKTVSRNNYIRYDNISDAYAVYADITDMEGGVPKPLSNPKNAKVSLIKPDGSAIALASGMPSRAEFEKLPSPGYFMLLDPAYPAEWKSAYTHTNPAGKLAGGKYVLSVDVEGDGQPDATQEITVMGAQLSAPAYGQKMQENGFDISWAQFGKTSDFIYRISFGQGFAGLDDYIVADESVPQAKVRAEPTDVGTHLVNFQVESAFLNPKLQDYYMGKYDGKAIVTLAGVKEAQLISFKVGDFCHCDDYFLPKVCNMEELESDPLCQ